MRKTKRRAFSLMEMMIVLVVIAIIVAVSAPMITKKNIRAIEGQSPLVWTGTSGSVAFNATNDNNKKMILGSANPLGNDGSPLHINTGDNASQITFGTGGQARKQLTIGRNGSIALESHEQNPNLPAFGENSIGLGTDVQSGDRGIAIGDNVSAGGAVAGWGVNNDQIKLFDVAKLHNRFWNNIIAPAYADDFTHLRDIDAPYTYADYIKEYGNGLYKPDWWKVDWEHNGVSNDLIGNNNHYGNGNNGNNNNGDNGNNDNGDNGNNNGFGIIRNENPAVPPVSVAIGRMATATNGGVAIGTDITANGIVVVGNLNLTNMAMTAINLANRVTALEAANLSDRRLKNVGNSFAGGLAEINKLQVFNYTFKNDKAKTPRVGVMAQDLQKIFPNAVTKGDDGYLRIRKEDMFYALINAVKELDATIRSIVADITGVKNKNVEQDKKIAELVKQNQEQQKLIKAQQEAIAKLSKRLDKLEK